ncbi:hypothetical protein SHELI_v1c05250 [Spiroplasma helicoides]|uniref:Uncharacterized protein n=1 Tax=Spiroplasma helicoides TaxID=216938 RepID=A0A1B3SKM6_9MOLU|nr:hypothetical protein [Spiroplasma helicoides]AOG60476.1 hypothetical protein SHELI_v1c05250 [Spiroplasma helicoides]
MSFNKSKKPTKSRYARVVAPQRSNAKSNDKANYISGVFKKEQQFIADKAPHIEEDPRYSWVQDSGLEDSNPVLNIWTSSKEQAVDDKENGISGKEINYVNTDELHKKTMIKWEKVKTKVETKLANKKK